MRQYRRIEASTDGARLDRAYQTMRKYVSNIKNMKSYQSTKGNSESQNIDQYFNNLGKARNIQYSRNTYMGTNAG